MSYAKLDKLNASSESRDLRCSGGVDGDAMKVEDKNGEATL